ncbi:MAG: hypothetical protein AVDCRST_MAG62-80, partial [uncultured Sphingomonas sp.]
AWRLRPPDWRSAAAARRACRRHPGSYCPC